MRTVIARMFFGGFVILGELAAAVMMCGCRSQTIPVESKCNADIKFVRQAYVNGRSPVFKQLGTGILSAFSSGGSATLRQPRFASAAMGVDQDGEYRLYIFWLEEKPSIDDVELRWAKTNASIIIPISSYDKGEDVRSTKVSVLMSASWIWSKTNSISHRFDTISDVRKLKIRLLAKRKTVTVWNPVSFYRLDRWMGSKNIQEINSGPAIASY